jgi:hypothetical protein
LVVKRKHRIKEADLPEEISSKRPLLRLVNLKDGRDELNLAEFPLATIADRVPEGQKTLMFEDEICDRESGELIPRKLTITGSDQYGLPTALDDEVILGLVQLTNLQSNFTNPCVPFTRYELIRLLGWRHEGKSYARIEESLNRWIGVTLYYEKAWWDREARSWVDEKFHILEHVSLYGRGDRRIAKKPGALAHSPSSFTWNKVVFRSFQADNVKRLDFEFYLRLKNPASKRAYRFLDKRFYWRRRWEFDLREFACEHVGLSRNYHTGELKRRLRPAIDELEREGFLEPLPTAERYLRVQRGKWKVVLVKKNEEAVQVVPAVGPLERELVARGVTPVMATKLVSSYSEEKIREKVEAFDWMQSRNGERQFSRNPAGYLVKAIQDDYALPKGFESKASRERRENEARERQRLCQEAARERESKEAARVEAQRRELQAFWDSLGPGERAELEREAFAEADSWLKGHAHGPGPIAAAARQQILDRHIRRMIATGKGDLER